MTTTAPAVATCCGHPAHGITPCPVAVVDTTAPDHVGRVPVVACGCTGPVETRPAWALPYALATGALLVWAAASLPTWFAILRAAWTAGDYIAGLGFLGFTALGYVTLRSAVRHALRLARLRPRHGRRWGRR